MSCAEISDSRFVLFTKVDKAGGYWSADTDGTQVAQEGGSLRVALRESSNPHQWRARGCGGSRYGPGPPVKSLKKGCPAPKRGANCVIRSAFTGGVVRSLDICTATPPPIEAPKRAIPDEQSKSSRAHSLLMPAMTPVALCSQAAHELALAPL